MERIVMHIDVNNAFLSWSALDLLNKGYKTDIREIDAVIGGDEEKRKGIVLAKSTSCKAKGIKTADTLYQARLKCPNLQIFAPNFPFYKKKSSELFTLLRTYTPDIEVASIDECYLDYGKVKRLYGDEVKFAYQLKARIKKELGFTVNIGIANNKFCAKMASDFSKPDKVHTLFKSEVKTKMFPLPIEDLFGIGKRSALKLREIGINTVKDLALYDRSKLYKFFKNMAFVMIDHANGLDDEEVDGSPYTPKGIGNELTLVENTSDKNLIYDYLEAIASNLAFRLRRDNKFARVVCVTFKDSLFRRKNHQKKLINPTCNKDVIFNSAKSIFNEMYDSYEEIRLIGIRLDGLTSDAYYQSSLFEDIDQKIKDDKLEKVLDNLKDKYGKDIIKKANFSSKDNIEFKELK